MTATKEKKVKTVKASKAKQASAKLATAKQTEKTGSDDGALSLYLREISRVPLLSRQEEDEIAKAVAKGDQVARQRLVSGNLRFVVSIAKKYQGQGIAIDDLIGEGNIGLMQAVDRFDASRGYHFISYAVWWIRQSILKAIYEKSRMIRLPTNRVNELVRIERARKYIQARSSEAEIREIASLLNMDRDLIVELLTISRDMLSLENPINGGKENMVLGDLIEDDRAESPADKALQGALANDIESVLASLDKKEADIIRCHYGLGNSPAMSLKELGDSYHLTKERIRQIEQKAVSMLQHSPRLQRLKAYVA